MLSPDTLDQLPDAVVKLWQRVEDDILRDVARRLASFEDLQEAPPTALWQLWRLDQVQACQRDTAGFLARYAGRTREEIKALLQRAGAETLASDDAIHRAAGRIPPDPSPALQNLLQAGYRQTLGTWQNLTRTTANTVGHALEKELDRAWLQVSSGAFDAHTAVGRAVDALAAHLPAVTYPSGRTDTLEVAVRRAVLTGVNQTAAQLQLARMDEMKCEFVEVTAHEGARPDHAVWQGKVYHRGGPTTLDGVEYEDFEAATGYGTGAGLCGWNCRHNFFPFYPGISVWAYTDEKLQKLADPAVYEARQRRRALEREVRAAKRQYLARKAADQDTAEPARRLKQAQQALSAYLDQTDGKVDASRTTVPGFGRKEGKEATEVAKQEIEKYSAYRYNKDKTVVVTDDRTGNAHPRTNVTYKPFAVVDTLSQNGKQHDRAFYDAEGRLIRQVSSGPHGNPKKHPYGQNGEHAHDIVWQDGAIVSRPVRELTEEERKENADIL